MHRRFLSRLIRAACGALPALGALGTTPTAAHSIPASFDCVQALLQLEVAVGIRECLVRGRPVALFIPAYF